MREKVCLTQSRDCKDYRLLIDYKSTLGRIYMFNADNKTAFTLDTIPWPVIWLLAGHHKKHFF